jgi:drug/metabolite transporter (DMT)-like permease
MMTIASADPAATSINSPVQRPAPRFGLYELMLYAVTVFAWSTSWIALKQQLGLVAPEVSLTWRFLLSGALMWGWVVAARLPWRFGLNAHLRFLALGITMFSLNFVLMYYAGTYLPSGLLSVVFALSSVFNLAIGRAVIGTPISPRIAAGGAIGIIGVGLMFWPQIAGTRLDVGALTGLAFAVGGTLSFASGNLFSASLQREQVPVMSANAWCAVYASILLALVAYFRGETFTLDLSARYLGSLVYLAVVSSGIAYWSYLTLLGRIGADRAGYAAVMYPVLALVISTFAEDYRWTIVALVGLALALGGNVLVLRSGKRV